YCSLLFHKSPNSQHASKEKAEPRAGADLEVSIVEHRATALRSWGCRTRTGIAAPVNRGALRATTLTPRSPCRQPFMGCIILHLFPCYRVQFASRIGEF